MSIDTGGRFVEAGVNLGLFLDDFKTGRQHFDQLKELFSRLVLDTSHSVEIKIANEVYAITLAESSDKLKPALTAISNIFSRREGEPKSNQEINERIAMRILLIKCAANIDLAIENRAKEKDKLANNNDGVVEKVDYGLTDMVEGLRIDAEFLKDIYITISEEVDRVLSSGKITEDELLTADDDRLFKLLFDRRALEE